MMLFLEMLDTEEEKDLFICVYEKYRYLMWYIANDVLKDAYLAEDAVQDALLAFVRHIDKVDDAQSKKTRNFLATITRNKALDLLRKKSSKEQVERKSLQEDAAVSEQERKEDILDSVIESEGYERILECIGQLGERYQVVFEYKYLHHLTDREIAEILGITAKTVNVRIYRARKKLQDLLKGER